MASDFEVRGRVTLKDEASPVAKRAALSFASLGAEIKSRLVVTAGDLVNVFRSVVGVFGDSIKAFADAEAASQRLDTALRSLGPAAADVAAALKDQAAELQRTTAFEDDAIISGQALLAAYTKNTDALKAGTQAAVDLAAATGQDLNSAFLLVGKAAAGNTAALSRYGIIIDENATKGEKFAATLEAIQRQFGGQAVAAAETFNGQMSQLRNTFGDFQEQLGRFIADGNRSVGVLSALKDATQFWTDKMAENSTNLDTAAGRARELASAQQAVAVAQAQLAAAGQFANPLSDFFDEAVTGATSLQKAQVALLDAETRLARARASGTAAALAKAEADKAAAQAAQAAAESTTALASAFDSLGVKTRAFNAGEASKVRESLALIRAEFLTGAVTAQDYASAVAAANEKLLALGDAAAQSAARIKSNSDEMIAAQEALAKSFQDEDDAAEAHAATLDAAAEGYDNLAESANSAAAGIRQVTSARSDDARTDVQIAEDNLAALRALGPFASSFTSTGGISIGGLGAESALKRKLDAARAAEGTGPEVGGSTAGIGSRAAMGPMGGGTRSLRGR